jgi:fermentation-respiration switch protein FrsA (DUF1100 family)
VIDGALARFYGADMSRRPARAAVIAIALVATVLGGCSSSSSGSGSTPPPTAAPASRSAKPHAVGVLTETFVDTGHQTNANGKCAASPSRTLLTTIWYPSTGTAGSSTPRPGASPARSDGPYPLIVFAHGFAATPQLYQDLLTQWAAAGFVVAAPLFPLSSAKSRCGPVAGDSINQPFDMSYVITSVLKLSAATTGPLAGLVNAKEVGAAGHSDGALTTIGLVANTCCHDGRIKAAAILAGTAEGYPNGRYDFSLPPPLFIAHGSNDSIVPYEGGVDIFNRAHGPKALLTITGGNHESAALPADVGRASIDFFDGYLYGDAAALTRLASDGKPGLSTMRFARAVGSTETIPTPSAPKLQLRANASATTNLTDGQIVTVTWSGYTPGKVVNILECTPSDRQLTNSAGCDYTHALLLKPDPTGSGSLPLTIVQGKVGTGVCDAAHPGCFILVNNASSTDPAGSVFIPITFAS